MTDIRLTGLSLSFLTIYSLISLSFNSWFHNIAEIYKDVRKTTPYDKYANSFQASFAFDILIFVWSLMGFLILRNPLKVLARGFIFFLFLLCIGKLISTVFFLEDEEIKNLNDNYANQYENIDYFNKEQQNILHAWKLAFKNMYASVVIELVLAFIGSCLMMHTGKDCVFNKVENS